MEKEDGNSYLSPSTQSGGADGVASFYWHPYKNGYVFLEYKTEETNNYIIPIHNF